MTDSNPGEGVADAPSSEESVYAPVDLTSVTASELIEHYSRGYVEEIYGNHIPSEVDGFKMIYRRYIYALRLAGLTNTIMRSSRAIAELQDAHPYNDTSMYEVIMRMAQIWHFNPPLVVTPSNVGTYSGNAEAASRYTSSGLSQYARDMFLDGVDIDAIPKVEGASLDVEISHFVPTLPNALLVDNLTIGYGKGCLTARLNFGNVCDLVELYAKHIKTGGAKSFPAQNYPEKFLPDFPTPCLITNAAELTEAYRRREYNTPICMDGRVIISKDRIIVQSLPHGLPFKKAITTIREEITKNKNGNLDKRIKTINAPRSKKMLGNFSIVAKQGVSTLELWRDIAPLIRFSGRFHPNPNYRVDKTTVVSLSYPMVLARWYNERKDLVMATKRRRLQTLTRQLWIAEAHMVVVTHYDRCIEIIRNMQSEDDALLSFKAEFNLTPFQGRELLNQNLRSLARISSQKLTDRIDGLRRQIKDLTDSFMSVADDIARSAQQMKKKYDKGRLSHIPDYVGYVAFADGIVLFENGEDVVEILKNFPKDDFKIYQFEYRNFLTVNEAGKPVAGPLHKYMYGDVYGLPSHYLDKTLYTVRLANGTICHSVGIKPCRRTEGVFYTSDKLITLTRKGQIKHIPVSSLSKRANALVSQGARTDIIHLRSEQEDPFYIAMFNDTEPNIVTIQRIHPNKTGFVISPMGTPIITESSTGKDWFIVPPQNCLSRCVVRVIHISDINLVLPEGTDFIRYDLNAKTKRSSGIVIMT